MISEQVTDIMTSKKDKAYTYNTSRRLFMIPENIKKLIFNTLWKKGDTPETETLDKLVIALLLTIYSIDILKLELDSTSTTWIFGSPPMI